MNEKLKEMLSKLTSENQHEHIWDDLDATFKENERLRLSEAGHAIAYKLLQDENESLREKLEAVRQELQGVVLHNK